VFKKMRGIKLPYVRQGLIYFTCRDYHNQPPNVQQKINNLCVEVAGEYYQALRDVLIFGRPVNEAALKHFCGEATLWRYKKRFYERW